MVNMKEEFLKKALALGVDGVKSITIDTIFGEFRIEGADLERVIDMVSSTIETGTIEKR